MAHGRRDGRKDERAADRGFEETACQAGALINLSSLISMTSSEVETCGVFLAFHLVLTYPVRVCEYFWLFRIYCTDHRSEKLQLAKTLPHLACLPVCEV